MSNKYRVDRAMESVSPPCGTNSILYSGDSWAEACAVFNHAIGGKDEWNQPRCLYGVMLSVWNPDRNDWIVKRWKSK